MPGEEGRPPILEMAGVSRRYRMGDQVVHALREMDLTVHQGELTAIMGPSGSGKSTMMNLLGCLDTPDEGRISINGKAAEELKPAQLAALRNREIGFVFQQFNLLPKLSLVENVAVPLVYARVPTSRRKALAEEKLREVGLGDRLHHRPSELSGGQKQRAAIARALINDPAILLADEPTGALDSRTGEMILALFQEINRRGRTVILVTHDEQVARRCRRIIRLKDGRKVAE